MNDFNVITVPSFSDFVEEARPAQVVRLVLGEKTHRFHGLPSTEITLDLQALNDRNELIWLSKSLTVTGFRRNGDFDDPREQARYEAMYDLERIVQQRLERLGFEVRAGRYVLPGDLTPLNGIVDCAEWYRDEDERLQVRAVEGGKESR